MNGFCTHSEFVENADGLRGKYVYIKRDIFKCGEHKALADYSDYRAKNNNISADKLAPLTARPKYSKGDNPGYRAKNETAKSKVGGKIIKIEDGRGRERIFRTNRLGIYKEKT